jgi:hypothetical protein
MRRELVKYFKEVMEPLTHEDKELLRKAGIKERPFFKSTKGANCMVVYAISNSEKIVVKFKAKNNPLFDTKLAGILQKKGIGVVKAHETKKLPKGIFYAGKEAMVYEIQSWAGFDFEISLKASIEALKSVNFDETNPRGMAASKLIGSDMKDAGHLAGALFASGVLYSDFKPANVAKVNKVHLFDIHAGYVKPSNGITEHAKVSSHYLDLVKYTLEQEAKGSFVYLWPYARDSFFEGMAKAGKTQPLISILEKMGW